MTGDDDVRRGVAICANCDAVHSVRIWSDGSVRPIGTGYGTECTCGASDFRIVDDLDTDDARATNAERATDVERATDDEYD